MMNILKIFVWLLFLPSFSIAQKSFIRAELRRNIDVWNPFSEATEKYQDSSGNIYSSTWGINLQSDIISKPRWSLSAGISYKKINYRVTDRIHTWKYSYSFFNSGTLYYYEVTRNFEDPADLVSESNSFGLNSEFAFKLMDKSKLSHAIGVRPDIYFLEYFNSEYESDDFTSNDIEESIPKPAEGPSNHLFFSSMNCDLFYRFTWYASNRLSIGAKVDFGVNLYSDWAEFKRYGYIGLGVELGFGNFKSSQKNEPNNSNE